MLPKSHFHSFRARPFTLRQSLALFFCLLISFLGLAPADDVDLDDPSQGGATEHEFGIDLHALSKEELEKICTSRGFELITNIIDDATGEVMQLTHDDYVEAARQCLSIERDLEQVIAEHPEILEELEVTRDRMMEEKERLEKKLEEASQKESVSKDKTAFIPKSSKEEKAKVDDEQVGTGAGEPEVDHEYLFLDDETGEATAETKVNITREPESIPKLNEEPQSVSESEGFVAKKEEPHSAISFIERKARALLSLLEPKVNQVLQKLDHLILDRLPPSVGPIVRKVLVRLKDDLVRTLGFAGRMVKALIRIVLEQVAARKEAAEQAKQEAEAKETTGTDAREGKKKVD